MTAVDWSDVVANDFQIPASYPLPELVHELSELLRSPEPALRDGVAYSTLATWISRGQVPHRLLVELGDEMAIRFADPEIQARTFAPLVLAVLASENIVEERWIVAFEQWWPAEGDVRGYDSVLDGCTRSRMARTWPASSADVPWSRRDGCWSWSQRA